MEKREQVVLERPRKLENAAADVDLASDLLHVPAVYTLNNLSNTLI
jgi:hypothetical protein